MGLEQCTIKATVDADYVKEQIQNIRQLLENVQGKDKSTEK